MTLATKPPLARRARPPRRSAHLHPVTVYARAVVDGKIIAGQLVKLADRDQGI